jgi:hypothetical protein
VKNCVQIDGRGIAAAASAALMSRFDWNVRGATVADPAIPFLTLDSSALDLLADIFGESIRTFPGYEISDRFVVQHHDRAVSHVRQPLCIIEAREILNRIRSKSALDCTGDAPPQAVIRTAGMGGSRLIASGRRVAYIFRGAVSGRPAAQASIFEFMPDGWIFWAPLSGRSGVCQFVLPRASGDSHDLCRGMLEDSVLLSRCVILDETIGGPLDCAASLNLDLAGTDWIACGGAALRYDPISGSGTATALRSAILACAVLRAINAASDPGPFVAHYAARLSAAFRQHVETCERLYSQAQFSSSWDDEFTEMWRAIRESENQFPRELQFRLENYSLISQSAPAQFPEICGGQDPHSRKTQLP